MFMMLSIRSLFCLAYFALILLLWDVGAAVEGDGSNETAAPTDNSVHIGLILDSASPMGTMVDLSISMAISDFYTAHPDYQTRLILHRRDAQGDLNVASAALELINTEEVHTILVAHIFTQDRFLAELGGNARVPIMSFTARSQYIPYAQSPYFIRTSPDDLNQARALASICKGFEWNEAVVLHEVSEYGSQFPGKMTNAFLEVDVQLAYISVPISTSTEDQDITIILKKLMAVQIRLFIVHMNANLGSRLFPLAKQAGIMSEGSAWIITDSIGNFMNSIDEAVIDSKEGVIGLRPYVPKSKNLNSFKARWKKNVVLMNLDKPESSTADVNMYGLWAYDTVWALAMAVEKIGSVNPRFLEANHGSKSSGSGILNLRISQVGPELVGELQNITFEGLSGEFQLINGQLKSSAVEIFNVHETGERPIGYWTPDGGIRRKLSLTGKQTYSTSTNELKRIVWSGDSTKKPNGLASPAIKLRVGVPKKEGFTEFINVSQDHKTGYSIEIFFSVLKQLDDHTEPEFYSFTGTYDELLYALANKTYDMVVGDVTILADRAKHVDFTLPYSEAGTVMVVRNRKQKDIWIFVKPFRWDLWLLILTTSICISIVLQILERRADSQSDSIGVKKHNPSLSFPISALAFPERGLVTNRWSRFVMVVWLLMAFILMQSYTANLSAMFTVDQLDYRFPSDDCIGVQKDSFVKNFLQKHLNVNESRIKTYSTIEQYHDAMTKGSKNGGIDAIFDEIPYMKLLIDRYSSKYRMVGPTYKTEGFGFAFPIGSPLAAKFSRAILAVTESINFTEIQRRYFGPSYSSSGRSDPINSINSDTPELRIYDFGGLFIIIGSALFFALFCSETTVGQRLTDIVANYSQKSFSFPPYRRNNSTVHPEDENGDLNISESDCIVIEAEQGNSTTEIHLSELRNTDVAEGRETSQ